MGEISHTSAVALARELWTGSFGDSKFSARIPADRVVVGAADIRPEHSSVGLILKADGFITDPKEQDREIGRFKRRLTADSSGKLVAHNDYIDLAADKHRTGFARGFHNHAVEGLRQLGADRIETLATDVGGYSWARLGFDYAVDGVDELSRATSRAVEARMAVEMSHAFDEISGSEYASLTPRLIEHGAVWEPGLLASTQDLLKLEGTLGKRILLGSGWHGVLKLRP